MYESLDGMMRALPEYHYDFELENRTKVILSMSFLIHQDDWDFLEPGFMLPLNA